MVRERDKNGKFAGSKYLKVDGKWYKGTCDDCGKPVPGYKAKLCRDCYWSGKLNPTVIGGREVEHYSRAHYWIAKTKGKPCECEHCGLVDSNSRRFHWANVSEQYLFEESDWLRLCASCHKIFDNKRKEVKV